jgi:hypothetical protein
MEEGCLVTKNAPQTDLRDKILTFIKAAIHSDDEQESIDGYRKQLSEAMDQFQVRTADTTWHL